ncbi:sensor histidine kinase [Streptomyces sp. NBC_01102]|uniref:sensor histidine kinase n=1 Tax=unclassified Streptomyces TaxID=2593676 RepID=UPI003863741E|nr:sensor histidine kinase [Streptomyces sp. NBC_01102]
MRLHGPRPTASRSHVRDIATVATLFAFSAGGSLVSVLAPGSPDAVWPSVLLSAIASTALFWRRTHPRAVAAVTALCILGEGSLGYLLTPLLQGPLMVALYSLGLRTCRSTTRTGALATAVLLVVTGLFAEPVGHYGLLLTTVNPVAWVLLPAVLGSSVRLRRDYLAAVHARAEHAERTREEEARHRVAQERMRIARELHDVVAHHLALANAQAGTAAHLARTHPERAQDMLDSLAGTTASALRELKATVGLLRQDSDPDAALGPAPGLAQVDDLITAFTGAGLAVTVTTEGEPRPLAPGADLTAFRIVQEALTNVTKHAGTGAAWVRLDYSADRLSLTVTDEGTATRTPPAPGHGFGLIGMRERAQSAGGVLRAGPRPEGGFEVSCSLPLLPPSAERSRST